jgi:membrane associated rhomboid family serine protease
MFVPLYDVNALRHIRRQYVTITLILINVLVFLVTSVAGTADFAAEASMELGFIPLIAHGKAVLDPSLVLIPKDFTYITYAFLHSDIWHIGVNMLFLWVFGDNVEDAMGHFRFLVFYLLTAAAAAWTHAFLYPDSNGPLIGASGAISAVVASYVFLHPRVRIWVLVLWRVPLPLPAFIPLAFWILQQFYMLAVDSEGTVSWAAHVGGILAGLALTPLLKRRAVPLLDRNTPRSRPEIIEPETPAEPPAKWGR